MATLGNAKALYLDDKIGNFSKGKAADFVVLDYHATPLIKHRMQLTETSSETPYENIAEKLFVLMMLGDDRVIDSTYIMGQCVYARDTA